MLLCRISALKCASLPDFQFYEVGVFVTREVLDAQRCCEQPLLVLSSKDLNFGQRLGVSSVSVSSVRGLLTCRDSPLTCSFCWQFSSFAMSQGVVWRLP